MLQNNQIDSGSTQYSDEISLRDLYLIFKKGFLWIVLAGALAGIITFVYLSLQPKKFVAESSTIVTPIIGRVTFNVGGENLEVEGGGTIPFNTYKALANSRQVVEATIARVPEFDGGVIALERAMSLSVLVGPDKDNQSGPLAVIHRISNESASLAAALADAWAEASLEIVRAALLDDLEPISDSTHMAFEAAEAKLAEAEQVLREFESQNDASILETELGSVNSFLGRASQNIMELQNKLDLEKAMMQTYEKQLSEELLVLKVSDPKSLDLLAGMTLSEAIAFVNARRQEHEDKYQEATVTLGEFDKVHDLDLVAEQEKGLRQAIASNQMSLMTIEEDIASHQVRLEWQLAELEKHPERNVFTQALLDNPLLTEGLRNEDGSLNLSAAPGLTVQVEELNPQYASLLSNTLSTQLKLAELEAKQEILSESVSSLTQQADKLRAERVDATIERSKLSTIRQEEKTHLDNYTALAMTLAAPGHRSENQDQVLGLGRSEIAQLRANIRDSEQRITRLDAELAQLTKDRIALEERAATLRSDIAGISFERRSLERFVSQQREAYNGVARLQPIMDLFGELAPGNARTLNPAVVPEVAEGGKLQPTIIAAVVGGLLATMFVFLREAIRDPNEERGVVTSRPATE